jgi:vesicle transport protein SEC22
MSLDGPQASRMSVDLGAPYMFHYIVEGGICYLTLADKGYPKKLAYEYLEELQKEFSRLYGSQVDTAARPYAFIKFGTFCPTCRVPIPLHFWWCARLDHDHRPVQGRTDANI